MLVRIEGLAVAIACLGGGWVVFQLFCLIGRKPRWVGRGAVSFRRDDDPRRPDETGTPFGIGGETGDGPPQGPGGASGGF